MVFWGLVVLSIIDGVVGIVETFMSVLPAVSFYISVVAVIVSC